MKAKVLYQTKTGKPQFKTMDVTKVGEKVYIADEKPNKWYRGLPLVYVIIEVNGILFVHQDTFKSVMERPDNVRIAEKFAENYTENIRKTYPKDYKFPARFVKLFKLLGEELPAEAL